MSFSIIWRTVIGWIGGILLTLVLIPPGLIILALDPIKQRLATPIARFWGRAIMRIAGIEVRVEGLENIRDVPSMVFAANHQSLVDVFVLYGYLPRRLAFLAKKQVRRIPVIGILMMILGHIFVDRANPKQSLRSIEKCIKAVGGNRAILVFPEGTRSLDGQLLPFKTGSLKIALRTGVPLVPVTLLGSFNVMPKNTFGVRPHPIAMHIGKPIPTEGLERGDLRDIVQRIEHAIRARKAELESRHPDLLPDPAAIAVNAQRGS